jgi:hypothetical protein
MGPKFDDVRIYNRALSATEIKQTLQCGKVERAIAGGLRNQIELFAKFRAVSRYGHDFRHAISETHSHESHAPDVKSEKPRKSRERKRSKRVKRQQPECKEKYRECQCRANRKQDHKLSKPSARH